MSRLVQWHLLHEVLNRLLELLFIGRLYVERNLLAPSDALQEFEGFALFGAAAAKENLGRPVAAYTRDGQHSPSFDFIVQVF